MSEFYELPRLVAVTPEALRHPRSKHLIDAIRGHRDYTLIATMHGQDSAEGRVESIVVEVRCDGVPTHNQVGIDYAERLAICIPGHTGDMVEVYALRRTFPLLMHRNHVPPGFPVSLCLYFESARVVNRTWTAQAFLRRIQWWLEGSATGTLHPADQPVEQLFFVTKFELVLPWNFASLQEAKSEYFLEPTPERPGGGQTFLLRSRQDSSATLAIAAVSLTLPSVVHGSIEQDPPTLGALADTLSHRGVDLVTHLRERLRGLITPSGAPTKGEAAWTAVVLTTPISRSEHEPPSTHNHRAVFVSCGPLKLAKHLGAFFELDSHYYRADGVGPGPVADPCWREIGIFPMEVLKANGADDARYQAGQKQDGPKGALIGVGALGSALLNLWTREGWGQWTAVDKDHIKPHNLSRHVAFHGQIGQPKAYAVADMANAVYPGAVTVSSAVLDVDLLHQPEVLEALTPHDLIVDASTTLDYPRAASGQDGLPRHVSTFISPNGDASVLLIEDAGRTRRLRTLEAQYYRAVIEQPWGAVHLTGDMPSFWSGASCRDRSFALSYAKIMGHAATLAQQIPAASQAPNACIRIWQKSGALGGTDIYEVAVQSEHLLPLGELDFYIDAGLQQQLSAMRNAALPNETGGVLLGYYDFNQSMVVAVAALAAPPDSVATAMSFERGVVGTLATVEEAMRRTAGTVRYLGEWHSHPQGHSTEPSREDVLQIAHLGMNMAQEGLPAIQLIVGDDELQVVHATAI